MAALEMNMTVTVDIEKLSNRNLDDRIKKVVQIAARNIEKDAKQRMTDWPAVDTGATRNSIFVDPGTPSFSHRIGPTTEYAPFIEFGTRYMSARPYMIPALEKEAPRFIAALSDDQMFAL
tara:strand:- start:234 stop:593 length:360 start_codon:yes stop_codon:yes gene_type:complete